MKEYEIQGKEKPRPKNLAPPRGEIVYPVGVRVYDTETGEVYVAGRQETREPSAA